MGAEFDSKLTCSSHIAKRINKSNKALHAIKIIRKYFSSKELITLLTANFYSVLYYNSEVWHLSTLKPELHQMLLSASKTPTCNGIIYKCAQIMRKSPPKSDY